MNTNKLAQKLVLACATLSAAVTLFATPAFASDVQSVELPAVQRTREPGLMVDYEWELPAVQRSGKPSLLPAVQTPREAARRVK